MLTTLFLEKDTDCGRIERIPTFFKRGLMGLKTMTLYLWLIVASKHEYVVLCDVECYLHDLYYLYYMAT